MAKKKEKTLEEKLQEALVPENQWPYMLPENWCWTRLGKITNVVGGGTPSSSKKEYYDNGTIPWLSPADLSGYSDIYISRGQKNITELGLSKSSACLMPKDTVLLSSRAPIGYVAIASNSISTNQGFKNFLPSDAFYSRFLYWYLKASKSLLESYASGTTFLELSGSKASMVEFPLPPLPEQKRIVHRIESLFAKLDKAKEKIQQVLDGAEMRKAAILHKAFTGELTKNWRKENGISEDSWEVKKLSDCGNWYGGGTPSKTHPEYWEKGNILWITSKDMKSDYIGDSQQHINSYGVENSSAKYIEEHALICVMRSGILRHSFPVAVIKKPFTVNQDLKVLVPNKMINIEYLLFICKYKEQSILNSCMKNGTTVESINFDKLKNFSIMIPAEIEQIRIVNIIKKFLCRENDVLNKCNKFITSIATMKKSILAKAFRGELGTNNPTEDSALNLLKEVLQDKS